MRIEKIIHFVWAGGFAHMPDDSIEVMLQWQLNNPEFETWLWVDNVSTPGEQLNGYMSIFEEICELLINDKEKIQDCLNHVHLKYIEDENVSNDFARYEIDRLKPNYGASSDNLRYHILWKYGGAYFDSDVAPGVVSLQDSGVFNDESDKHRLYVDQNSQNSGEIGNDALICTAKHPVMQDIFRLVTHNYDPRNKEKKIQLSCFDTPIISPFFETLCGQLTPYRRLYESNRKEYILNSTPQKTGPLCVRALASGVIKYGDDKAGCSVRSLPSDLRHVLENQAKWVMDKSFGRNNDKSYVISCAVNSLLFEVNNMGLLRLDDHIDDVATVLGVESELIVDDLMKEVGKCKRNILLAKDLSVQLSFKHLQTYELIRSWNIPLDRSFLFPAISSRNNHFMCEQFMADIGDIISCVFLTDDLHIGSWLRYIDELIKYCDDYVEELIDLQCALCFLEKNITNLLKRIEALNEALQYGEVVQNAVSRLEECAFRLNSVTNSDTPGECVCV